MDVLKVNVIAVGDYFNVLEWKDKSGSIYGLCEGMTTLQCYEDEALALRVFRAMEAKVNRNIRCITQPYGRT
jgi:hypothetical protein